MRRKRKKATKKFTRKMQGKLVLLFVLIALALFGLNVRISYINHTNGNKYTIKVLAQQGYDSKTLPYQRGDITDRNGVVLATSEKVYNLVLDAKIMNSGEDGAYLTPTLTALNGCFGFDIGTLSALISQNPDSQYIVYQKGLAYSEIEEFVNLQNGNFETRPSWFPEDYKVSDIKGVWFEEEYKRYYPYDSLACDLLGFVNAGNVGSWGIEQYYNDKLNGTNGRTYGYLNSDSALEKVVKPATDGNTVVTTIDMNLQMIAEKYVKEYYETVGAKNVAVMMMDPNNGEILAQATAPFFNLNDPRDLTAYFTQEEIDAMSGEQKSNFLYSLWKNFALSETYEPGSTGKPFTVAAALEEARVYSGQEFLCEGSLWVGGHNIHCHNIYGDGIITLEESIKYSCNVAMMLIAQDMGKSMFIKYQNAFGFGTKTGVDLPGEENGQLYTTVEKMDDASLATNSFGQNYNVTMMQMMAGFSSLVNGGAYYEPHVMKKIVEPTGGTIETAEPLQVKETISRETSKKLRQMLYDTVEGGTGSKSKVEGYTIGGKTGTAEKHPREEGRYLVSFISFAPVDDPQIVLYVVIDEPNIPKQSDASQTTIMSNKIYTEILPYLGVFPEGEEIPEEETATEPEETETSSGGEEETTGEEGPKRATPVYDEIWENGGFMGPADEKEKETQEGETREPETETTVSE